MIKLAKVFLTREEIVERLEKVFEISPNTANWPYVPTIHIATSCRMQDFRIGDFKKIENVEESIKQLIGIIADAIHKLPVPVKEADIDRSALVSGHIIRG